MVNGRSRKAIALYSQMRNDGLEPDCVTYNTVIRAYTMERSIEQAFHVLQEMRMANVKPNIVT